MLELREITRAQEFDATLDGPDIPFTQRSFYGEWQRLEGRRARMFAVLDGETPLARFQIIAYALPPHFTYWYIPHGPILAGNLPKNFFAEFQRLLLKLAEKDKPVFIRFDVFPPSYSVEQGSELKKYFTQASAASFRGSYFQPKFEWVLDISKPDQEILDAMHKNARYGITASERKEVTVDILPVGLPQATEEFYTIMKETAVRDKFSLHSKEYYRQILEECERNRNAFFAIARYGNKTLVMHLVLVYGHMAYHVFGGSRTELRNLMPVHGAHWASIKEAKKRGCKIYNFGGVSGGHEVYKNLDSLTFFKTRFGGFMIEYGDFYDMAVRPVLYQLYILRKHYRTFLTSFTMKLTWKQ